MEFLTRDFFGQDPLTCARELIGCELVWRGCVGRVVETEAYLAEGDEACHTFVRPSTRAFVEAHPPGTAYVYLNYGVHWLLNVLVKGGAGAGFVLFRALEPLAGVPEMERRRWAGKPGRPVEGLCSGPGKLSAALGVDGKDHGLDLCRGAEVGFVRPPKPARIVRDVRIGISRAAHFPWRFLLRESRCVSAPPAGGWKGKSQTAAKGRSGF